MPIKIPNDLPAFGKLEQEGVQLIGEDVALRQDIRPMQVALLNLMPDKPRPRPSSPACSAPRRSRSS
jgi:homoserine O-succinyltransferase